MFNPPPSSVQLYFVIVLSICLIIVLLILLLVVSRLESQDHIITQDEAIGVASKFNALAYKHMQFESSIAESIRYLFSALKRPSESIPPDDKWLSIYDNLKIQYNNLIASICETAVFAISSNHGGREGDVSVNLKVVVPSKNNSNEYVYKVRNRSSSSDQSRDDADAETKNREFRIEDHMIYSGFFGAHTENLVNGVFIIDDIKEYVSKRNLVNETRIQNGLHPYKEPSDKVFSFYKSCIVCPIQGDDNTDVGAEVHAKWIDGKPIRLMGIMCIDSKKVSYFDKEYDVEIMKQLSAQSFSATRALANVDELRASVLYMINSSLGVGKNAANSVDSAEETKELPSSAAL